jgi:hypothetical protein
MGWGMVTTGEDIPGGKRAITGAVLMDIANNVLHADPNRTFKEVYDDVIKYIRGLFLIGNTGKVDLQGQPGDSVDPPKPPPKF